MEIEKQVKKAASLINQLREVDTDFRVFGAETHRYRIGPTLSEDELRAFEIKHAIELPPDYRLYLKTVGDGNGNQPNQTWGSLAAAGVGPDYGIYRLEDSSAGSRIREAFPYDEETEIDLDLSILWESDIPGLLEIGSQGCTGTTHLSVKGTTYGTIWNADSHDRFWPTGLSFTQWICKWAERAIPQVIRERVIKEIKEGMPLQKVIAICSESGKFSHSLDGRHLRFEHLRTAFEIDESDKISRIINHSI